MKLTTGQKVSAFIVLLLIIDQVSKIWIKTNMHIGESISVFGDWFQILFIENKGMAFGMQFGGDFGKIMLTLFRVVLSGFIIFFMRKMVKQKVETGVLVGLALILTGAIGNLIDSLFYGLIFSESTYLKVAEFLPESGGYAPLFMGKVVDMLYFPLIDTVLPEWVPFKGGEHFVFFRPIFNIADSCISVGAVYLILFKWKFFSNLDKKKE